MTQSTEATSLQEAAKPYLNKWGPYRLTRDELNQTAIWRYCEVAEDPNPMYWDREFAEKSRFGRLIAPPQSVFSMTFAPWWSPEYVTKANAEDASKMNGPETLEGATNANTLVRDYGYTVATVVNQEAEYLAPFGPGDGRLKVRGMTLDVSAEKQTRVGRGVFITSVSEYRTEKDDRLVARSQLTLLMYNPSHPRGD